MVTVQCVVLILFNMVFSTKEPKLSPVLTWIVKIALGLLVIYGLLSVYSVVIRIDQYGLTVGRLFAIALSVLLLGLNLAYVFCLTIKYKVWLDCLHKVNVGFAVLLFIVIVLINSPLLDFRKISVDSQLARIDDGLIDVLELDGNYFDRHLLRPGYLALLALEQEYKDEYPDLIKLITRNSWDQTKEDNVKLIYDNLNVYGESEIAPERYTELIDRMASGYYLRDYTSSVFHLLIKDLNQDTQPEYIMMILHQKNVIDPIFTLQIEVFEKKVGYFESIKMDWVNESKQAKAIVESLSNNEFKIMPSSWSDLQVGEYLIKVNDR